MGLAISELMHFFGGALTQDQILNMPFSMFLMYREYMGYILNWQSEKGIERNKQLDRQDKHVYGKKRYNWFEKIKNKFFNPSRND